jgi:hypothetical protein
LLISFRTFTALILLAFILFAGSICSQNIKGGSIDPQRLARKKRPAGTGHSKRPRRGLKHKHSTHKKMTGNPSTRASQTPSILKAKKAGDWSGDVRDLPTTPPKKRERPKLAEPHIIRKVYKKPPM